MYDMNMDVNCELIDRDVPSVSSNIKESIDNIIITKSDELVTMKQQQQHQQQQQQQQQQHQKQKQQQEQHQQPQTQQQQQQQFHQFRAPQEFAKHKAAATAAAAAYLSSTGIYIKKHKTWSKRQNKNGKCNSTNSNIIHHYYNVDIGRDLIKKASFTKADLENIQILNQNRLVTKEHNADDESNCTIDKNKLESASLILRSSDHGQLKQQPFCRKLLSQHKTQLNHAVCSGTVNPTNYLNSASSNTLNSYSDNGRECNTVNNIQCYTVNNSVGITDFSNSLHRCCIRSRFFLSDKRPRKGNFIPPTKFLLGGNISDPLNLNSLKNEPSTSSVNNTPISTPRQSPITTPPKVEVLIPPNIRDPLHLLDPVDSMEYEKQLTSPMKRGGLSVESKGKGCRNISKSYKNRRKHRKLKRRRFGSINSSSALTPTLNNAQNNNVSRCDRSMLESDTTLCSDNNSTHTNGSELTDLAVTVSLNKTQIHDTQNDNDNVAETEITNETCSNNTLKEGLHLELLSTNCNATEDVTAINTRKRKLENNLQKTKKYSRSEIMDKIVSPVIPPSGSWLRQVQPSAVVCNNRKSNLKTTLNALESCTSEGCHLNNEFSAKIAKVETHVKADPSNTCILPIINNQKSEDSVQTKSKSCNLRDSKYCYGNYNRYKGLRCLNEMLDVRLKVFYSYPELFKNKDILDIGCNVGHMTISVARYLEAKSILGIDIDQKLISQARRNLSMYVRLPEDLKRCKTNTNQSHNQMKHSLNVNSDPMRNIYNARPTGNKSKDSGGFFPISFPLTYGGVLFPNSIQNTSSQNTFGQPRGAASLLLTNEKISGNTNSNNNSKLRNEFPHNVFFRTSNYVLKNESQLANDVPQYDLILCLSVTKWIHLNFGDNGLKLAFKRMFNQLRPGGKLILEMQNWASYKKDKKLTEKIYNNYKNIELLPYKYHEYLLSTEVGFSHSYTLGVPKHLNKGFCRPLQLYAKGDYTPNHVRWSDAYCPQTPFETQRGIYATMPFIPTSNKSTYPMVPSNHSQNYNTPQYLAMHSCQQTPYSRQPTPYSRQQTPMYQPNTSQYYNPLETDSYLPSYDIDYLNHMYVFASPLHQTVWSPPTNFRHSSSYTPAFGSIRDIDFDAETGAAYGFENNQRHVYPPNDETYSPNAQCTNAFNSFRDTDADDMNQLSGQTYQSHVYATNCNEYCSPSQCNQDDRTYAEDIFLNSDDTPGRLSGSSNCFD